VSVLLVDDNLDVLSMLTEHLALEGIIAASARSADDALRLHRERRYPVILTDLWMPGRSGIDLIREIRRIQPTCIAFVMTGFGSTASLVECLNAGAADYFVKPIDIISVITSLREALRRQDRWKRELGTLAGSREGGAGTDLIG
jgi:DNA-binding NtrC family response regulator